MSEPNDRFGRYDRLAALVLHEQQFYWNRFGGFATLHGGLFVVVSVALPQWDRYAVGFLGLTLAILWFVVQLVSLWYVDRWKKPFHEERERLGLNPSPPTSQALNARLSSTDMSLAAPVIVILIWIAILAAAL